MSNIRAITGSSRIMNRDSGGGSKLQGIPSSTNLNTWSHVAFRNRNVICPCNRNVIFCVNQLGGVGAGGIPGRSYAFAPGADGVNKNNANCMKKWVKREYIPYISNNYRLSDLHSALGISQLSKLKKFIEYRKKISKFYNKHLISKTLINRVYDSKAKSAYHLYIVRSKKIKNSMQKKKFFKYLKKIK